MKSTTKRLTELTMLIAIVVVLTVLCTFIRFGPFSITLALIPIIVGSILYGPGAGALLGAVFGLIVLVTGLFGWDGGTVLLLLSQNLGAVVICLVKGAAAGWIPGLIYKALGEKNEKAAVVLAAIAAPVTNTLLFIIGMFVFYTSTLESWASGQAMVYFLIFGLTGINFLIELITNLALTSAVTAIIKYKKS